MGELINPLIKCFSLLVLIHSAHAAQTGHSCYLYYYFHPNISIPTTLQNKGTPMHRPTVLSPPPHNPSGDRLTNCRKEMLIRQGYNLNYQVGSGVVTLYASLTFAYKKVQCSVFPCSAVNKLFESWGSGIQIYMVKVSSNYHKSFMVFRL